MPLLFCPITSYHTIWLETADCLLSRSGCKGLKNPRDR